MSPGAARPAFRGSWPADLRQAARGRAGRGRIGHYRAGRRPGNRSVTSRCPVSRCSPAPRSLPPHSLPPHSLPRTRRADVRRAGRTRPGRLRDGGGPRGRRPGTAVRGLRPVPREPGRVAGRIVDRGRPGGQRDDYWPADPLDGRDRAGDPGRARLDLHPARVPGRSQRHRRPGRPPRRREAGGDGAHPGRHPVRWLPGPLARLPWRVARAGFRCGCCPSPSARPRCLRARRWRRAAAATKTSRAGPAVAGAD